MQIQFGKNPEITLSVNWRAFLHSGYLALPFAIKWWAFKNAGRYKSREVSFLFLGLELGLEIWRYENEIS